MSYTVVFTGTRAGMTPRQLHALPPLLVQAMQLYHGCCHGADTQCHSLARKLLSPDFWIEGFPGNSEQATSGLDVNLMHEVPMDVHPELRRNRAMLYQAKLHPEPVLIGAPRLQHEEQRSGTWATIRHARKLRIHLWILWPDGAVKEEVHG